MHIIQKSNILNIKEKPPGSVMPVLGNSATPGVTDLLSWAVFPPPQTVKDVNVAKEQKPKNKHRRKTYLNSL